MTLTREDFAFVIKKFKFIEADVEDFIEDHNIYAYEDPDDLFYDLFIENSTDFASMEELIFKMAETKKEDIPENETLLDVMLKTQHGVVRLENGIYVRIYMEDFE